MKKEQVTQGLGMASPTHTHQKLIGQIHKRYAEKFSNDQMLLGVAVVEEPERVPDISVWKHIGKGDDDSDPLMTIEITHTMQNDRYSEKSIIETFLYVPTLEEAFIYNYTSEVWIRYRREKTGIVKENGKDYSRVMRLFLHTLLK